MLLIRLLDESAVSETASNQRIMVSLASTGIGGMPMSSVALAAVSTLVLLTSITLLFVRIWRRSSTPGQGKPSKPVAKPASGEEEEPLKALRRVPVAVLYGTQTGTAEGCSWWCLSSS